MNTAPSPLPVFFARRSPSKFLFGMLLLGAFLLGGSTISLAGSPEAPTEVCNTPNPPKFGLDSQTDGESKVTWLSTGAAKVKFDFIPEDEREHRTSRGYPCVLSPEGVFGVEAHGTRKYVYSRDGEYLSAEDFAELIRSDSRYEAGMPVVLFCCETGKGFRPFAQKLANLLGAEVVAPTEKLWPQRNGRFIVAQELARKTFFGEVGLKRADLSRQGTMKTFSPSSTPDAEVTSVAREESAEPISSSSAASLTRTQNPPKKPLLRAGARTAALLAGMPERNADYFNATEEKAKR
jgi:hypothetical protein